MIEFESSIDFHPTTSTMNLPPLHSLRLCEPSCARVCKAERPTFGVELPPEEGRALS